MQGEESMDRSRKDLPAEIDDPGRGEALREAIFYSGESAYTFQYRDFSPRKYAADDEWLRAKKGFTIQAARDVVHAVGRLRYTIALSGLDSLFSYTFTKTYNLWYLVSAVR